MIEMFSLKRMILFIAALVGVSILIFGFENILATGSPTAHLNSNNSKDHCWLNEKYKVTEECQPCHKWHKDAEMPGCNPTGYREKVHCDKQGDSWKSCDGVPWLERRNFWLFEVATFCVGVISTVVMYSRQKQLDQRMMERIQKQIAAGV